AGGRRGAGADGDGGGGAGGRRPGTRRYETANGFAADVQRYLADEPVLACPPSAGYRLRKFAHRNKGALVTAALLSAMLLAMAGSFRWVGAGGGARRGRAWGGGGGPGRRVGDGL